MIARLKWGKKSDQGGCPCSWFKTVFGSELVKDAPCLPGVNPLKSIPNSFCFNNFKKISMFGDVHYHGQLLTVFGFGSDGPTT